MKSRDELGSARNVDGKLNKYHFSTLALHEGYNYNDGRNIFPPIDMGVAFPFEGGEEASLICSGEEEGYVYARTHNHTNTIFEKRLAVLEGGGSCLATSSGLAAIFLAILGLLEEVGKNFICSNRLYGNTQNLLRKTFPLMQIESRWVKSPSELDEWEKLIDENTKFLFVESPSNPDIFVGDIAGLVQLARKYDIKLLIDSTLATPVVFRPLEIGADVVVHSTTKYISGHSASLGGAIIGETKFIEELRAGHHHYIGPTMSAFNAWLTLIGLETLEVRMTRMINSAQHVAEFLEGHPNVVSVNFPGLKSHLQHEIALEQMGSAGTSLMSFEVKGGTKAAWMVIENLEIPCHATHLGGNQSVVVHPATTTHGKLTPEQKAASGVPDGLIRLSVGLEDKEDLIQDLDRALSKI